jgi:hypothetical protein
MTTVLLEVAIPKDKDVLMLSMLHLMNFVLWPIILLNLLLLIPLGTFTHCKGNLTDLRRELHLSLAKGNPK